MWGRAPIHTSLESRGGVARGGGGWVRKISANGIPLLCAGQIILSRTPFLLSSTLLLFVWSTGTLRALFKKVWVGDRSRYPSRTTSGRELNALLHHVPLFCCRNAPHRIALESATLASARFLSRRRSPSSLDSSSRPLSSFSFCGAVRMGCGAARPQRDREKERESTSNI